MASPLQRALPSQDGFEGAFPPRPLLLDVVATILWFVDEGARLTTLALGHASVAVAGRPRDGPPLAQNGVPECFAIPEIPALTATTSRPLCTREAASGQDVSVPHLPNTLTGLMPLAQNIPTAASKTSQTTTRCPSSKPPGDFWSSVKHQNAE
ncbi:uncharacterized protein BDZ99DRAFT_309683 [Mytilinidion resinicola]|uniref:Uncharacterized protein n=1 Tax=Mytilinidion resinicola TaxID=574789 RepID=A0A6A6YP88_9PEZI|nr:uncharacterized protein BDZ99DRAFT_309683 [Mytilinidion resinicola]KAF2810338.1 hypothetical protein BDZ99DRAFT_309683 [Mytilinidion resinicola]